MRLLLAVTSLVFLLPACSDGGSKADRRNDIMKATCKGDQNCGEGFICTDKVCVKGQRSKAEVAAKQKAKREELAKKAAAKKVTKPGEGRLEVRICPVFKNTPEAIGTLVAKHIESGKEHYIHLAREVKDGGWQDVFTFYSLPLGQYAVTTTYGIQVKGRPDVVKLRCHEKVKKDECQDEVSRLMTVVLPADMPPPEKDKDGKIKKKPCDWIVE